MDGSWEGNIREAAEPVAGPFDRPLVADALGYGVGMVSIDLIDAFEGNPRFLPNPKYQEIKHSIARAGYDGILPVTQRPGSERYVVTRGGNTSLQAFRELRAETGDPRFDRICVQLEPYRNELTILDGHDRENNVRSGTSFGERAHEVRQKRIEFEKANGPVSDNVFIKSEHERGFKIDVRDYRRMRFWTDEIAPFVPGIHKTIPVTRRTVQDLLGFKRAVEQVWFEHDFGPSDRDESGQLFEATFQGVLEKFDAIVMEDRLEAFDVPALKAMVIDEMKMSDLGGKEAFTAEMVEAAVRARSNVAEQPNLDLDAPSAHITPPQVALAAPAREAEPIAADVQAFGPPQAEPPTSSVAQTQPIPPRPEQLPTVEAAEARMGEVRQAELIGPVALRGQAFELARELAERHRFAELVRQTDKSNGFFLTEFHPHHGSTVSLRRPAALWYVLFSISDPMSYSVEERSALLEEHSELNRTFSFQDGLSFLPVAIPHEQQTFGFVQSFLELDERDRQKVFRLLDLSQRLRQLPHDLTNPKEGQGHD